MASATVDLVKAFPHQHCLLLVREDHGTEMEVNLLAIKTGIYGRRALRDTQFRRHKRRFID
jgi:hypothetical protein